MEQRAHCWIALRAIAHRSVSSLGQGDTTRREMTMARPSAALWALKGHFAGDSFFRHCAAFAGLPQAP